LDRERLPKLHAFQAFEKNRHRTKQFIIERHPFQRRLNWSRHDVDWKHLAAKEIFERVNDENDGGNFQNPERHHRERVSDEELDERRHHCRTYRERVSQRIVRKGDVVMKIEEDERNRRQRDESVNEPAGGINPNAARKK